MKELEKRSDHNMLWSGSPGRPGGGLFFNQVIEKEGVAVRRMVYILVIIGSNPWFQRVTSRPDRTVRKTTRCRPPRRRPDRVLCRFHSIKTNFKPDFTLRGQSPRCLWARPGISARSGEKRGDRMPCAACSRGSTAWRTWQIGRPAGYARSRPASRLKASGSITAKPSRRLEIL